MSPPGHSSLLFVRKSAILTGKDSCRSCRPQELVSYSRMEKLTDKIAEKLTDKIAALPPNANYFSLEFFPPKTQAASLKSSHPALPWLTEFAGVLESTSSSFPHVPIFASSFRDRHMGSRGEHGDEIT